MSIDEPNIRLLLVDDEEDFREATGKALARRGFAVVGTASGREALQLIAANRPGIVILDLKMPGLDGIATLRKIREVDPTLPVIVLTGHGTYHDAFAGLSLQITDFAQKPVDIDRLATRIWQVLRQGARAEALRERTIAELMVPPSLYPRLTVDQPADVAFATLSDLFFRPQAASVEAQGIRTALVFDRDGGFVGMLRFNDLLKLVLPRSRSDSPYSTSCTGMFLAQCKVIGPRTFTDVMARPVTVDVHAPLMHAVQLMVEHRLNSLPVMDGDSLVGVLRDRAIVLEIAKHTSGVSRDSGHGDAGTGPQECGDG